MGARGSAALYIQRDLVRPLALSFSVQPEFRACMQYLERAKGIEPSS